jgi:hypothetical protein
MKASVRLTPLLIALPAAWAPGMPASPNNATQSVLASNPGLRTSLHGSEMTAIYGVPFAWDSSELTDTQAFVENFLAASGSALGVVNPRLVLTDAVTSPKGTHKVFIYTQEICDGGECLPVHGAMVKIPVLLGETETIGYVGISLVQPPSEPLPPDLVDAGAVDELIAGTEYGYLTDLSTPEKVILETADRVLHRTWRFAGSDDATGDIYSLFVDTNTGQLVRARTQLRNAVVAGHDRTL